MFSSLFSNISGSSLTLLKNGPINSLGGGCNWVKTSYQQSRDYYRRSRTHNPLKKKHQIPMEKNLEKPHQEWWDWDGIGRYKSRHHGYPINMMLRDVQKRRMLEQHNEKRIKINAIWKNDILPKELRELAFRQIQEHPRDSTVLRINRRCAVTGKARGIFHQFRVSRFIFRQEADHNRISGAQRAFWLTNIDIKP